MADFAAQHLFSTDLAQSAAPDDNADAQFLFGSHGMEGSTLVQFLMRGQDASTNGLYDTWIVDGGTDFAANQYTGGLATPLRDVTSLALPSR